MKQAMRYCDRCSQRVLEEDVEHYGAIITDAYAFCPQCAEQLSPEEREAALASMQMSASAEKRLSSPPRNRPGSTPPTSLREKIQTTRVITRINERIVTKPPFPVNLVVLIAVGGGTIIGLLAGIMAFLPSGEVAPEKHAPLQLPTTTVTPAYDVPPVIELPPMTPAGPEAPNEPGPAAGLVATHPVPAAAPASPLVPVGPVVEAPVVVDARPAVPSAAQRRLDDIGRSIDGAMLNYRDVKKALRRFATLYPNAPERASARHLLEEVERKFAKVADERFKRIGGFAKRHMAAGKFGKAREYVQYQMSTFDDSAWFAAAGRAKFDRLLASIDAARRRAEKRSIRLFDSPVRDLVNGNPDTMDPWRLRIERGRCTAVNEAPASNGWGGDAHHDATVGEVFLDVAPGTKVRTFGIFTTAGPPATRMWCRGATLKANTTYAISLRYMQAAGGRGTVEYRLEKPSLATHLWNDSLAACAGKPAPNACMPLPERDGKWRTFRASFRTSDKAEGAKVSLVFANKARGGERNAFYFRDVRLVEVLAPPK